MKVLAMALDPRAQAALGLSRFGLSPLRDSLSHIDDVRAALLAELDDPAAGTIAKSDLPSSPEAAREVFEFRQERKEARLEARDSARDRPRDMSRDRSRDMAAAKMDGETADQPDADAKSDPSAKMADKARKGPGVPQQIYLDEAAARFDAALDARTGFVERLVWFWSNHFCVSAAKNGAVRALCGAYEREAIRPHVRGKFADMLIAAESHPAMLLYLDNARSIGPQSIAGRRRNKGLNENLAREILELHTLGVRTGYSQDDVTNFAKVITGWSIVPPRQQTDRAGQFIFNPRLHEPGKQRVLGRDYAEGGFEQGRAVLTMLARHPATAKHIAFKLARHFVADAPPDALVDRLANHFLDSDGDLKQVATILIRSPEAWDAPRSKLRKPSEWVVAALRVTGASPRKVQPILQAQNLLGEPLWRVPAPNGFSDDSAAWMDGLAQRLDIANQIARRAGGDTDPQQIADQALGPLLSDDTREAIKRAESRPQALALLLMSPEFQRR